MSVAQTALARPGHFLILTGDAERVDAQWAGRDLMLPEAGALRDDASTDEITPDAILSRG